MKIVIAHQSSVQKARIRNKLLSGSGGHAIHIVSELHETYDYAEHHEPDCVIISHDLADRPEFELLYALFNIIGIGCVVLQATDNRPNVHLSQQATQRIVKLNEDATTSELAEAINRATGIAAKRRTPSSQAQAYGGFDPRHVILIGASTGGVDALLKVIAQFPADCPPTLIVQHTGGTYASSLIRLLNGGTAAQVVEATEGMTLSAGQICLAPDDHAHLQMLRRNRVHVTLNADPPVSGHRPSVDALFQSAVHHAPHVTAAILTGMGRDGAAGITALGRAGARTFGQDEATSVVYGMPRIAMEMGGIETQLPIDQIGAAMLKSAQARVA